VAQQRPELGRIHQRGLPTRDTADGAQRCIDVDGERMHASVYRRSGIQSGFRASGPAVIEEPSATTLIMPGQSFEVDAFGNLVISLAQ